MEVKDFLIEMVVTWPTAVEKETSASCALNHNIPINKACTYAYTQHVCTDMFDTHTHTCTNMYDTHAYTQTCTHTYSCVRTRTNTHVHMRTHPLSHAHTLIHTSHMYTYTHRHLHANKFRHAFTVTSTHISSYAYTKHTLTSLERFALEQLVQRN